MGTSARNRSSYMFVAGVLLLVLVQESNSLRSWRCSNDKCVKERVSDKSQQISIEECKLTCLESGGLWPLPTVKADISKSTVQVNVNYIQFSKYEMTDVLSDLLTSAENVFLNRIRNRAGREQADEWKSDETVYSLLVHIDVYDPSVIDLQSFDDESYKLKISIANGEPTVQVHVAANTFFGARHALETLNQLVIYDDIRKRYRIVENAEIEDKPVFTHRGIVLDTARSYISVENILSILDLMSMNKMNTFHWHITDTHSFPYVSKAYPQLSEEGAYSEKEVYTQDDIRRIVDFARVHGIKIIPEFDAPAHVGEGWEALDPSLITCFKWEPWKAYCVEPPCGQFDPTNEKLYDILGTLFEEYLSLFPSNLFHMGGDEVSIGCWQNTRRIVSWMEKHKYPLDEHGFHQLWIHFQNKAYEKLKNARCDPHPKPILWTSTLTSMMDVERHIKPEDYIIQIWTKGNDHVIRTLLRKNYQLIFSNYDELYFDCGGPSWVGNIGHNWCSPYIGWQTVYEHSPFAIALRMGKNVTADSKQILGSEAAIWTEQIDDHTVLTRLWPRSAALAERLWSNPAKTWEDAQDRMNHQRERMVANHGKLELLQPKWCYQNDGACVSCN